MKRTFFLWLTCAACYVSPAQIISSYNTADYIRVLKQATDVMINDATSPVAAARYYAYISLSANETAAVFDHKLPRFFGALNGSSAINVANDSFKLADAGLAILLSLNKSSTRLLPSGYLLKPGFDSLLQNAKKKKLTAAQINTANSIAEKVTAEVLQYASKDGFVKLSGMRRFTPSTGDEYWQPTAPGFMAAVEPYWHTLRTFFLDSCNQFAGRPPIVYSPDTTSEFYRSMKEVYEVNKHLSKQQSAIANFWDCNPFALQQVGHLEFGLKKISPGGHWMGITGIACKQQKLSLQQTAYVHALVATGLADAFVACWSGKYKYNRVRPVTAIKRLIDANWSPLLQTPPFPEYTSGHSVISTTAATILTDIFGEHFSFTDDTEKDFGLPARRFTSFLAASQEAAISRLYGGIHFRDAIENGQKEGELIGRYIIVHSPHKKSVKGAVAVIKPVNQHR
jgi:hypothetical protein